MRATDLAQQILVAERPLLFIGHGLRLSGHQDLFWQTIHQFELPYMTTSHAKGTVAEESALFFGVFGIACPPENEQKLKNYRPDLIVSLGSRLGEVATLNWSQALVEKTRLIQVLDTAEDFNSAYPTATRVVMDLGDLLRAFWKSTDTTYSQNRRQPAVGLSSEREFSDDWRDSTTPIHPIKLIRCLEQLLPPAGLLVTDIGNSMAWSICHFSVLRDREFYVPLSLGSMGSGIGSAIGAKLAQPNRPVFCLVGDCATLMYGSEVVTARENKAGVIFIILNDRGHGMVDHGHKLIGLSEIQVRFSKVVDFKMWAEALGLEGHRVDSTEELMALPWKDWVNAQQPIVIDARIDENIVPPIKARARIMGQGDQVRGSE